MEDIEILFKKGQYLHSKGKLEAAKIIYEEILSKETKHFGALNLLAIYYYQTHEYEKSKECLKKAFKIIPNNPITHFNYGMNELALLNYKMAASSFEQAIKIKKNYKDAYYHRGIALLGIGSINKAIEEFNKVIELSEGDLNAYFQRAGAYSMLGESEKAVTDYDKVLAMDPEHIASLINRSTVLVELNKYDEAIIGYLKTISLKKEIPEVYFNLGNVYSKKNKHSEAIDCYKLAIKYKKNYYKAWNNYGLILAEIGKHEIAIECYNEAINVCPNYRDANYNKSVSQMKLGKRKEALASIEKAIEIDPNYEFIYGTYLFYKQCICDWTGLEKEIKILENGIRKELRITTPFPTVSLLDDPYLQLRASKLFSSVRHPLRKSNLNQRTNKLKIKVGYFSADFHNHATSYLISELLNNHDKDKFETYGYSFGSQFKDEMNERISKTFDQFLDVSNKTDDEIYEIATKNGLDIAVDLKGYTQDCRVGIFSKRVAPIQINFLGYPGTMGSEYIDYIIADPVVIPEGSEKYYSEQIITMPTCYQVNDSSRRISTKEVRRSQYGLPEGKIVFCCFNNNYKILPKLFKSWMNILKRVENSVIWLIEDNAAASENLRKSAMSCDINPERLIFTGKIEITEHLARHRLADLFLDTYPCNAHTTASDALWAGLPIVTIQGKTFSSRVASSLLINLGLEALVVNNYEQYESLVIELANDPIKLNFYKELINTNKKNSEVFDGKKYVKNLEKKYIDIVRALM